MDALSTAMAGIAGDMWAPMGSLVGAFGPFLAAFMGLLVFLILVGSLIGWLKNRG